MIGLERMKTAWDPQIVGTVGAALCGYALCQKGKGRQKSIVNRYSFEKVSGFRSQVSGK